MTLLECAIWGQEQLADRTTEGEEMGQKLDHWLRKIWSELSPQHARLQAEIIKGIV